MDEPDRLPTSPPETLEIVGARASIVAERCGMYDPLTHSAVVVYWLIVCLAIVYFKKGAWGQDRANLIGAIYATVFVASGWYFYIHYLCTTIASSRIVVDQDGLTISAMQKFAVHEYHFPFDMIDCIVFGQRRRPSQRCVNDVQAGRLFILDKNGGRTAFQYINKAFDQDQLVKLVEVLEAHEVEIMIML